MSGATRTPPGSAGSSVQHNGTPVPVANLVDPTAADLVGLGLSYGLTLSAKKTATYTAGLNEFVTCDTTAGAFTVNLPGGSSVDRCMFGAGLIAGASAITLQTGPGDVFDQPGGATTKTLAVPGARILCEYLPSSGVWVVLVHSISKTAADLLYAPIGGGGGTTLPAADGGDPSSTYGAADFIDGGTP